jgi:hypothetical protein
VEVEVPESQQPSRRRKAQGRPAPKATRERARRPAANAPERKPAEEALGAREPSRDELVARQGLYQAAWAGRTFARAVPRAVPEVEAAVRPVPVPSPVQGTVDRRDLLTVFSIDTKVVANGQVLAILRRPAGYPSGPLPGDPSRFAAGIDPRQAVCHVLSPAAAARCLRGGGYF